jgi:hypothetical protein
MCSPICWFVLACTCCYANFILLWVVAVHVWFGLCLRLSAMRANGLVGHCFGAASWGKTFVSTVHELNADIIFHM